MTTTPQLSAPHHARAHALFQDQRCKVVARVKRTLSTTVRVTVRATKQLSISCLLGCFAVAQFFACNCRSRFVFPGSPRLSRADRVSDTTWITTIQLSPRTPTRSRAATSRTRFHPSSQVSPLLGQSTIVSREQTCIFSDAAFGSFPRLHLLTCTR